MGILKYIVDERGVKSPFEELKSSKLPVLIYGAGVYAHTVFKYLIAQNIKVSGIVVSKGYPVIKEMLQIPMLYEEDFIDELKKYFIVIGVANYPSIIEKFKKYQIKNYKFIDVPNFLDTKNPFFNLEFIHDNIENLDYALSLFSDKLSQNTFIAAINSKLNMDASHTKLYVRLDHQYFPSSEIKLNSEESFLDVGGYIGDSILDFHKITSGQYKKIISLEPCFENFIKLEELISEKNLKNIYPLMIGAYDEKAKLNFLQKPGGIENSVDFLGEQKINVDTIDNILSKNDNGHITIMKFDINGSEFQAITGAAKTIVNCRPRIATKIHIAEDFFRLPILLKHIAPEIKLYLRQRNYPSMTLVLYGFFEN